MRARGRHAADTGADADCRGSLDETPTPEPSDEF
jgi:hypothetical protein